jgi:hypothetical protein
MTLFSCAGAGVFGRFRGLGDAVWLLGSVMMNRSVTVDVNIGAGTGNFTDVFKAVGRDSTVCECQSSRRQDATHEIKQRHQLRDTTSCQMSQNSTHETIMSL